MRLTELLKEVLDSFGIRYREQDGAVQLMLYSGAHKWGVSFSEDSEGFLKYYARYPWHIPESRQNRVLSALNEMNASLRAGCFFIHDSCPVFRYGVYIFDEFTARESVADLILTASARTEAAWDKVYDAVCGMEVG